MTDQNPTPLNIAADQGANAPEKEQWSTPKVEVFDSCITESGGVPLVEALNSIGDLTS